MGCLSTRFQLRIEGKFRGIHVACGGKTAEAARFEVLLLNVVVGQLEGLAKEIAQRTSKLKGHRARLQRLAGAARVSSTESGLHRQIVQKEPKHGRPR